MSYDQESSLTDCALEDILCVSYNTHVPFKLLKCRAPYFTTYVMKQRLHRSEHSVASEKGKGTHGPLRASMYVRSTSIMDYNPRCVGDVCPPRAGGLTVPWPVSCGMACVCVRECMCVCARVCVRVGVRVGVCIVCIMCLMWCKLPGSLTVW